MPCYDDRNAHNPKKEIRDNECRKAARILCSLVKSGAISADHSEELLIWWKLHQKIDAEDAKSPAWLGNR